VCEQERERERELWKFDRPSLIPHPHSCYDRGRDAKTIRLGNEKWNAKSLGPLLHEKHIGGGGIARAT